LKANYILKNILDILLTPVGGKKFNLIYASGLFDYLTDGICKKVANKLLNSLEDKGVLIICNASISHVTHRAYYEFLGGWKMIYRKEQDMLSWMKDSKGISKIKFDRPSDDVSYLFMRIEK